MLIYAGIDEAGYGPMLGPLTVACTAFVLETHDPEAGAPNLWKILNRGVCRKRRDTRKRIAVDDSKKLKGANDGKVHPLTHLERGVLAFLANRDPNTDPTCDESGARPETDDALFERLNVEVEATPWYTSPSTLPLTTGGDQMGIAGSVLRRTLNDAGVSCEMIQCEAIDAGPFNEQVQRMGTKAAVNFCSAARLLESVWRRWPDDHPRVIVDRHGGRTHYRNELQMVFPDASIQILAESEAVSRYRLHRAHRGDDSHMTISFVKEGDQKHFPVALASMTAKYVRELLMLRMNRFFTSQLPELKPTAGYFADGRRYMRDVAEVVDRLGVGRDRLVRSV